VSTITTSATGGRHCPSGDDETVSYAEIVAETSEGSRRRYKWVNASFRACGAMEGQDAVMFISLSTAVRPMRSNYFLMNLCGGQRGAHRCSWRCTRQDQRDGHRRWGVLDAFCDVELRAGWGCRIRWGLLPCLRTREKLRNIKTTARTPVKDSVNRLGVCGSSVMYYSELSFLIGHLAQLVARTLRIELCVRSWVQLPQCPCFLLSTYGYNLNTSIKTTNTRRDGNNRSTLSKGLTMSPMRDRLLRHRTRGKVQTASPSEFYAGDMSRKVI
jgi:hypothetical protein